jgi:hypothetical protein
MDEDEADTSFGYERFGQCAGCDSFASLNDLRLCSICGERLEHDQIGQCDWDDALAGLVVPEEKRQSLRAEFVREGAGPAQWAADKSPGEVNDLEKRVQGKRRRQAKPR